MVDTDVVSYWTSGNALGQDFSTLLAGHELAISFATYGELLAVPHKLKWGAHRLADLKSRLRGFVVVPYSAGIAEIWAQMHARVSGHLHQGGVNDMWTAACALGIAPTLPIATNNLVDYEAIAKHFPALKILHPSL